MLDLYCANQWCTDLWLIDIIDLHATLKVYQSMANRFVGYTVYLCGILFYISSLNFKSPVLGHVNHLTSIASMAYQFIAQVNIIQMLDSVVQQDRYYQLT